MMDKKPNKPNPKNKIVKDAGDVVDKAEKLKTNGNNNTNNQAVSDRGDSTKKVSGIDKKHDPTKQRHPKLVVTINEREKTNTKEVQNKEIDVQRKLRDNTIKPTVKKTLNSNISVGNVKKEDTAKGTIVKTQSIALKNEHSSKILKEQKGKLESNDSSSNALSGRTNCNKQERIEKRNQELQLRKPIIRTITSLNDKSKIYKAVTFVDQKKDPTALKINIPGECKNKLNIIDQIKKPLKKVVSKVSVKEKPQKKIEFKKKGKKKHIDSADIHRTNRSPPTEVAKWAPNCINNHTKLYYEAWVDTTLAAISKTSKDKQFLGKQSILQSYQKALAERPSSPELIYENMTDERYTGKIKVRQR